VRFKTFADFLEQDFPFDSLRRCASVGASPANLFQLFFFLAIAALLAIGATKIVVDNVGGDDFKKSIQSILVLAYELAQVFEIIGAELEIGILDKVIDDGWASVSPVAHGLDDDAGDHRLGAVDEFGPERLVAAMGAAVALPKTDRSGVCTFLVAFGCW
jgi:hypothetical protein